MPSRRERPEELICAVTQEAAPRVEAWFVGGRGSRQEPLRVELLGTLDAGSSRQVFAALQQLMGRNGPWLVLRCDGLESVDPTGVAFVRRLAHLAGTRNGSVELLGGPWPLIAGSGRGGSRRL